MQFIIVMQSFPASLRRASVSDDPLESILIYCFAAQYTQHVLEWTL